MSLLFGGPEGVLLGEDGPVGGGHGAVLLVERAHRGFSLLCAPLAGADRVVSLGYLESGEGSLLLYFCTIRIAEVTKYILVDNPDSGKIKYIPSGNPFSAYLHF